MVGIQSHDVALVLKCHGGFFDFTSSHVSFAQLGVMECRVVLESLKVLALYEDQRPVAFGQISIWLFDSC